MIAALLVVAALAGCPKSSGRAEHPSAPTSVVALKMATAPPGGPFPSVRCYVVALYDAEHDLDHVENVNCPQSHLDDFLRVESAHGMWFSAPDVELAGEYRLRLDYPASGPYP